MTENEIKIKHLESQIKEMSIKLESTAALIGWLFAHHQHQDLALKFLHMTAHLDQLESLHDSPEVAYLRSIHKVVLANLPAEAKSYPYK